MGEVRKPSVRSLVDEHLLSLEARSYARATLAGRRIHLDQFRHWCESAGAARAASVSAETFETYQRYLLGLRKVDGNPLAVATRTNKLVAVRMLWAWAHRSGRLKLNPAAGVTLPRLPRRLPRAVMTTREMDRVLAQPDCSSLLGLCDRAIMEVLYSTGMRRMELTGLDIGDLDAERGTVFVRGGKGDRDRVVPIGDRAIHWASKYRARLDAEMVARSISARSKAFFLNARWRRIRPTKLTERMRRYIVAAGIAKPGSVHIFRHTMATLMHDGGADIRDLQEILGHSQLSTTEIYTHVSIGRLKEVHSRTHPAAQLPIARYLIDEN